MTGSIDQQSTEPASMVMDDWEILEAEEKEDALVVIEEKAEIDVDMKSPVETEPPVEKDGSLQQWMRKTGVAVVGGTMIGVGLVMIPLPTPCGCIVAGSGMAVLGTEFPAAQRALDKSCNAVADAIEGALSRNEEVGEEKQENIHANETMKVMMLENQRKQDGAFKNQVRQIAKKAAPAIRKIGHGIDKAQLEKASNGVSQAATGATKVVGTQASRFWRNIMVLDEDEALLTPFKGTRVESS